VMQLVDETDPAFTLTASCAGGAVHPGAGFDRQPAGDGVGGRAIVEDRLCVAENDQDLPSATCMGGQQSLRSAMAVPIRLQGRAAGSLVVASKDPERRYGQRRPYLLR
jgi:GAF domain-containing protein